MIRLVSRALVAALVGALTGPVCLLLAHTANRAITFDMDRDLPTFATGFYPVERDAEHGFVWTSRRADIVLAGLDRRSTWSCSVRFRGARPSPATPQPEVMIAVDGVSAVVRRATNEYQEVDVRVPSRPVKPGLTLAISSSSTFVPGGSDRRTLGVQVQRLSCRPLGAWLVLPPEGALGRAAFGAAAFGAAFGLSGIAMGYAAGATALVAAAQAVPLSTAAALYGSYPDTLARLAGWIALVALAALTILKAGSRKPLGNPARFVVLFSAAVLYLKLLGLLHPSKGLVDALFHAHRLDAVLAGHFYFTQLSTSATPFPYAIGLYLFAAPWSVLTRDHVALLRIVVAAAEAIAGAFLYLMVIRTWGDRLAGAVAVVLFHLVPVSYLVVGNANLTNAFGASAALTTVAAATIWVLGAGHPARTLGLALLATLAFISHVSTVALLLPTLLAFAFFFRWMGGADAAPTARSVLLATLIAVVCSVGLYYAHFGELYKAQLARMRAPSSASVAVAPPAATAAGPRTAAADGAPRLGRSTLPLARRITDAVVQTVDNIGWPILILALVGAWRVWAMRAGDRLRAALAAWVVVGLVFVALSVVTAVHMRYQQDAWEFIGRVEHAACPAAAILAASGAVWAWRAGFAGRLLCAVLLVAAVIPAAHAWHGWIS